MDNVLNFLLRHTYSVLFTVAFADQLGIPMPAAPFLIGAGALARSGDGTLAAAMVVAVAAASTAHWLWYEGGRRRGRKILNLMCRIALEPDACVRRTENLFARHGLKSLLLAPFVPGIGSVAQPLAGMLRVPFWLFMSFEMMGAVLWAGTYVVLGYAFGHQLVALAENGKRVGGSFLAVLVAGFGGYIAWKLLQRYRLLRRLRIARIGPEELKRKLAAGEPVVVIDLRHSLDVQADSRKVPGALQIAAEELEERDSEIPRGREIVVYCS